MIGVFELMIVIETYQQNIIKPLSNKQFSVWRPTCEHTHKSSIVSLIKRTNS